MYHMRMPLLLLAPAVIAFPKPPDYSVLSRRIARSQSDEEIIKVLFLDAMLPRQRVQLQFAPPVSTVLSDIRDSGECLAVCGLDQRTGRFLRHGVEARIESMSPYRASQGFFSSHSTTPMRGFTALDTTLVGGKRCEVLEPAAEQWPPDRPIFEAKVRWLPSEKGTAAATVRAESLEELVDEWLELVRTGGREREPLQITRVLCDLGPMPDAEDADDRALWVAALINPLPALGVSREIRPAVLEAADGLARVNVVHEALTDSIGRLRRNPPGPFEVEPPPKRRGS